jgi:hypothetical protein
MARVLIYEPHDDIRDLIALVVRRLGHEPVSSTESRDELGVDAAVIEPGEPEGLRAAIRMCAQGVPLLFTSIFPADEETLALNPAAYLVKPFPLYALEHALANALVSDTRAAAAASGA